MTTTISRQEMSTKSTFPPSTNQEVTSIATSLVELKGRMQQKVDKPRDQARRPCITILPSPPRNQMIRMPNQDDVLCGRGSGPNQHPGNKLWRSIIAEKKVFYLSLTKKQKSMMSKSIVDIVRSYGGRFLQQDPKTKFWFDIGNSLARRKTGQALRENAPEIRIALASQNLTTEAATGKKETSLLAPKEHQPSSLLRAVSDQSGFFWDKD